MSILTILPILALFQFPLTAFASGPYESLSNIFDGQLANLSFAPQWGNPLRGGQDYYHCCLLAVNQSLAVVDGNLTFQPGQTALRGSIEDFQANPFPCGGTYDGSNGHPAQVWVSYNWCNENCPGWAMSWTDSYSLKLWLKPLVAFITPAAIFCLNIPRRRRVNVSRHLFPRSISSPTSILSLCYKVPIAALIVTLDLVLWTILALTLSGPMILSAIYEALLDARLLRYLQVRIGINGLTVKQRAHLLVVTLFGSLDQDPAWNDCQRFLRDLPDDNLRQRFSSIAPRDGTLPPHTPVNPASSMSEIQRPEVSLSNSPERFRMVADYATSTKPHIHLVKIKLKSALETQMGFGSAAGAAIVFYVGNFACTLIELQGAYGDLSVPIPSSDVHITDR